MKKSKRNSKKGVGGGGLLNKLIDILPVELHIPGGYQYCGPGTHLKDRLARGDKGINELDKACLEHDKEYDRTSDSDQRRIADQQLASKAWERAKAWDSGIAERAAALSVATAMKVKSKIGGGCTYRGQRRRLLLLKQQKKKKRQILKRKENFSQIKKKKQKNVLRNITQVLGKGLYLRPSPLPRSLIEGRGVKKKKKNTKRKNRKTKN